MAEMKWARFMISVSDSDLGRERVSVQKQFSSKGVAGQRCRT